VHKKEDPFILSTFISDQEVLIGLFTHTEIAIGSTPLYKAASRSVVQALKGRGFKGCAGVQGL
jgi:hypothetical protein